MGASDLAKPDFQLGNGCLVDQMIGQVMAHICGLGYLTKSENIRRTLRSIMQYNLCTDLHDHFNTMRSFALGDEKVLLMASFPNGRPEYPFPYFTEAMTGFEYTAAIGMLQEGQIEDGLTCIRNIRQRYDGQRRSPFDEAECGHHYARAMIAWAAALALTGFRYSAVDEVMAMSARSGTSFWTNGYAWGTCRVTQSGKSSGVRLSVLHGRLQLKEFHLRGVGEKSFASTQVIDAGEQLDFTVKSA